MTSALFRWSHTTDAEEAEKILTIAPPVQQPKRCDPVLSDDVLTLQGGSIGAQVPCTTYALAVTGFGPADSVLVTINSTPITADLAETSANGEAIACVTIPIDFEPGDHTIVVGGADPDGSDVGYRGVRPLLRRTSQGANELARAPGPMSTQPLATITLSGSKG